MTSDPVPTLLTSVRRHLVVSLRNAALVALAVVLVSFAIPNQYTASTVVLPPGSDSDLSSLMGGMPGTLALSRALGIGAQTGTDLYVGVLRSGRVAGALVKRFELVKAYRAKDAEKATRRLADKSAISLTNEGFVRVSVTDRDRQRAADLANAYVAELDGFLRENTNQGARQRREFLERRLGESRVALRAAEDAFRDYQVRHRLPAVVGEGDARTEGIADLVAGRVSREVELGTLRSVLHGESDRARQLQAEIAQMDRELVKLPPATTELARLYRSLKIEEKILLVLTEETERARLQELRNFPSVEVVDVAGPPLHKSHPRRALLGIAAFLLAYLAGAVLLWVRDRAIARA